MSGKRATTKAWFGNWSNEYDNTLGKISFHQKLLDLLVKSARVRPGEVLLDLGCGTGLLSLKLLQFTECRITAVDNSPKMLAIFREKIKKLRLDKQIACRLMDADSLIFKPDTFDKIVSTVTLHHLKNK